MLELYFISHVRIKMGGSEAEYCDINVFLVKACIENVIFHNGRQSSRREVMNGLSSLMQILVSYHSPSHAFGDDTGRRPLLYA